MPAILDANACEWTGLNSGERFHRLAVACNVNERLRRLAKPWF